MSVPVANPRYYIDVVVNSPGAVTERDLRVRFRNVDTFASATQPYTLSFYARSNGGSSVSDGITVLTFKNFGSGGNASPSETNPIESFDIATSWTQYSTPITFGENSDKDIGDNDDDYLDIIFRFPLGAASTFDLWITDVMLVMGEIETPIYPTTTSSQDMYESLFGRVVPKSNGDNLYLPLILTQNGINYDESQIGKIFITTYDPANRVDSDGNALSLNELTCDGSNYRAGDYTGTRSALGFLIHA